jgi:hypothetical protein
MVMINDLWENELVVPRCSKYFSDFHCAQNGMMFGSSTEQFFGVPWSSLWQPSGKKKWNCAFEMAKITRKSISVKGE